MGNNTVHEKLMQQLADVGFQFANGDSPLGVNASMVVGSLF